MDVVLENHLVLQLLLDDVDDVELAILGHHHEIFVGVEGQEAPPFVLCEAFDQESALLEQLYQSSKVSVGQDFPYLHR